MIEQKINVGEFLDFGDITGHAQLPGTAQVSVGCVDRTIGVHKNWFGPAKREVADGTNNNAGKAHRNFIWLPWADNGINYIQSQGKDVLSGPFSGCYMVVYNYNGNRRVAHIATPGAKAAWNNLVATDGAMDLNSIQGFMPHVGVAVGNIGGLVTGQDSVFKFFGLVTAAGQFYSILTFVQHSAIVNPGDPVYNRIASINLMPSTVDQNTVLP